MSSLLPVLSNDSQTIMLPPGISPALMAPVGERADLEPIPTRAKRLKANGQAGAFVDSAGNNAAHTMEGVILYIAYPQAFFAPKPKKAHYEAERSWQWPQGKPICSAPDFRKAPRVHRDLTDEQKAEVIRRGGGTNCQECPLRHPVKTANGNLPPLCDRSRQLLFLPREGPEPVIVQINAWNSMRALDTFMRENFRFGQFMLRPYSYVIAMGFEAAQNDKGNFHKLVFQKVECIGKTDKEQAEVAAVLEKWRNDWMAEADESEIEEDDHTPEPAQAAPSSGRSYQDPPPPSDADAPPDDGWHHGDGMTMDDIPF